MILNLSAGAQWCVMTRPLYESYICYGLNSTDHSRAQLTSWPWMNFPQASPWELTTLLLVPEPRDPKEHTGTTLLSVLYRWTPCLPTCFTLEHSSLMNFLVQNCTEGHDQKEQQHLINWNENGSMSKFNPSTWTDAFQGVLRTWWPGTFL
jgi:hypothetical protein